MQKRILILCDHLDEWSVHNRAKAIKKFLPDYDISMRAAFGSGCLGDHDRFDLVHFNFTAGLDRFERFIAQHAPKCVITVVNERSLFDGYECDPARLQRVLMSCPNVTTLSQRIVDRVHHAVYIPNGIDVELFPVSKPRVVGYVGTLKPNKNCGMIEEACKELGLELAIARYMGANKQAIPHDKMHEFYASLDVYVHASLTEGFNNTVLEAIACNTPVVMTRVGAWREFEGYVTFIQPSKLSLVEALKPWTSRSLVESRFTWQHIVPKYRHVYEAAYQRANHA